MNAWNPRPNEHRTNYTSLPQTTTTTPSSSSQPTTATTDQESTPTNLDSTALPTASATEPSAPDTSNPLVTSLDPAHVKSAKATGEEDVDDIIGEGKEEGGKLGEKIEGRIRSAVGGVVDDIKCACSGSSKKTEGGQEKEGEGEGRKRGVFF
ncbi:hypothetical protein QBC36DRAFT_292444 [Triangularia setosa]|uniref:Uncharacterized protein n=1 Tax=Triangularia setosa TaxID=2587417 RepID=A0AAN7A556_9PEZI|nr:hypothetical protein QBC36DRAFT_292444 [Podospora setosa]